MLNALFQLRQNQTTIATECLAGLTSFVATMYIVVVNPVILSQAGMTYEAVLTATVLVCFFSSIMMGLYANNPIVVAPGMGINAFFAYSIILGQGVDIATALGAVFWSGIIFLLLSLFGVRTLIIKSIPVSVRYGSAVGIGLFIALIGLVNAHFIVVKSPFIGLGSLNPITLTFIAGFLLLILLILYKVPGALIVSVVITTLLSYPIGRWYGDASSFNQGQPMLIEWNGLISMPDFSYLFALNLVDALHWSVLPAAFGLLFTDFFDSMSTFVGVAEAGDLKDSDGEPRNIEKSMVADSFATIISGITGSSPGTAYIESAAGIQTGGRTGLTAVCAGFCFLPLLFFAPLIKIVPDLATAPVLVIVGLYMIKPVAKINWHDLDEALPAFLAMMLIPLTYSITYGVIWGLFVYSFIKIFRGHARHIHPALLIINVLSVVLLILELSG